MKNHDPRKIYTASQENLPEAIAYEGASLVENLASHVRLQAGSTSKGVAIVESGRFLRECLWRGVEGTLDLPVQGFSSLGALEAYANPSAFVLVLLSWLSAEQTREQHLEDLRRLRRVMPDAAIVVLSSHSDSENLRLAIGNGAQGFIPVSVGLELAVKAVQFVLAGGTYAPPEVMLGIASAEGASSSADIVTSREMMVVRKIQQGKPNKIIAFELNMCESTVKVHVRQIMKKLGARNRTDLAIKAHELSKG